MLLFFLTITRATKTKITLKPTNRNTKDVSGFLAIQNLVKSIIVFKP